MRKEKLRKRIVREGAAFEEACSLLMNGSNACRVEIQDIHKGDLDQVSRDGSRQVVLMPRGTQIRNTE
jgi:hypothetical protein